MRYIHQFKVSHELNQLHFYCAALDLETALIIVRTFCVLWGYADKSNYS